MFSKTNVDIKRAEKIVQLINEISQDWEGKCIDHIRPRKATILDLVTYYHDIRPNHTEPCPRVSLSFESSC